jgi:hypothetical protein
VCGVSRWMWNTKGADLGDVLLWRRRRGVEAGQAFMAYCLQRVVDKTGWMAWCFLAVWGSRVV